MSRKPGPISAQEWQKLAVRLSCFQLHQTYEAGVAAGLRNPEMLIWLVPDEVGKSWYLSKSTCASSTTNYYCMEGQVRRLLQQSAMELSHARAAPSQQEWVPSLTHSPLLGDFCAQRRDCEVSDASGLEKNHEFSTFNGLAVPSRQRASLSAQISTDYCLSPKSWSM